MNTMTTKGIKVSVSCRYETEASNPTLHRFIHSYRIKIENLGSETVKLISRFWLITDGDGGKREVSGDGVVGEQPTLQPGEEHTYTSWCPLSFPTGKMEGHFNMRNLDNNEMFSVKIPGFTMNADFKEN
jgi:ApaG protein